MRQATTPQVEIELSPDFQRVGRGSVRALDVHDQIGIDGWVLGNSFAPKMIEVLDEESHKFADAAIDGPRPDVGEAFPDLPGTSSCGFLALLRPPKAVSSVIRLRVLFEDGAKVELATLTCTVDSSEPSNGDSRWTSLTDSERDNEKVLHGKNGWLFLRADSNDIVGQQIGTVKLGPEGRARWRKTLKARVEASKRLQVPWTCLVVPDKESVYPEHLPEEIKPAERRPVHEFLEVAEELKAPVAYALDWLASAKAHTELYATTDTHWNYRGANPAGTTRMRRLRLGAAEGGQPPHDRQAGRRKDGADSRLGRTRHLRAEPLQSGKAASYPIRMIVSPLLSVVDREREEEIEHLLESYARRVSNLLQEIVRLTAGLPGRPARDDVQPGSPDHVELLSRAGELEEEIRRLQASTSAHSGIVPSRKLGYRAQVAQLRSAVMEQTQEGSTVLVISRGDRELVSFEGRHGQHFPQDEAGRYAGHHPADSEAATPAWWLDHYEKFARYLGRYRTEAFGGCTIYRLEVAQ